MPRHAELVEDFPKLGCLTLRPAAAKDVVYHRQRERLAVARIHHPREPEGLRPLLPRLADSGRFKQFGGQLNSMV